MYYIRGVEVAEALGDVGQLATGVNAGEKHSRKSDTYECKPVCTDVLPGVFWQVAARHPIRYEL